MARARNLKPGFFKNEDLAECSFAARLCFAGLWTIADREGRLEDRPKRIKGELFAFDDISVDPLLDELQRFGFIRRYEVDGVGVIQILAFHKHQKPHHREPESAFPPPGTNPPEPRADPPYQPVEAPNEPRAEPKAEPRADPPLPTGSSPGKVRPSPPVEGGSSLALLHESGKMNPVTSSLWADGARAPGAEERGPPTLGAQASKAMREAGATGVNPSDPELLQLLAQGVTPRQLGDLAAELRETRGSAISARYAIRTMIGRLRDAASQPDTDPATAQRTGAGDPARAQRIRERRGGSAFGDEIDRISAAIRKGVSRPDSPMTIDMEASDGD